MFVVNTHSGHVTQAVDTLAQQPNIDHNEIAFISGRIDPEGKHGIYVSVGNHLDTVIEAGDILDGRTVAEVQIGFDALEGRYLAFEADFTDGSSGITGQLFKAIQGWMAPPSMITWGIALLSMILRLG